MLLLALTGYGATNGPQRSTERGFDYHLVKPVDADQLTRLITESPLRSSSPQAVGVRCCTADHTPSRYS